MSFIRLKLVLDYRQPQRKRTVNADAHKQPLLFPRTINERQRPDNCFHWISWHCAFFSLENIYLSVYLSSI